MDPEALIGLSFTLTALALTGLVALRGWQGWLELRRLELERGGSVRLPSPPRIDVADLKARVRRLEAIADGVDL